MREKLQVEAEARSADMEEQEQELQRLLQQTQQLEEERRASHLWKWRLFARKQKLLKWISTAMQMVIESRSLGLRFAYELRSEYEVERCTAEAERDERCAETEALNASLECLQAESEEQTRRELDLRQQLSAAQEENEQVLGQQHLLTLELQHAVARVHSSEGMSSQLQACLEPVLARLSEHEQKFANILRPWPVEDHAREKIQKLVSEFSFNNGQPDAPAEHIEPKPAAPMSLAAPPTIKPKTTLIHTARSRACMRMQSSPMQSWPGTPARQHSPALSPMLSRAPSLPGSAPASRAVTANHVSTRSNGLHTFKNSTHGDDSVKHILIVHTIST